MMDCCLIILPVWRKNERFSLDSTGKERSWEWKDRSWCNVYKSAFLCQSPPERYTKSGDMLLLCAKVGDGSSRIDPLSFLRRILLAHNTALNSLLDGWRIKVVSFYHKGAKKTEWHYSAKKKTATTGNGSFYNLYHIRIHLLYMLVFHYMYMYIKKEVIYIYIYVRDSIVWR